MELISKPSTLSLEPLLATALLGPGCGLVPTAAVLAQAQPLCNDPLGLFALAEMTLLALLAVGMLAGVLVRAIATWSAEQRSTTG